MTRGSLTGRRRLARLLAPWLADGVEHVGSTAVPGLAAKPVIDLMVSVADPDVLVVRAGERLAANGSGPGGQPVSSPGSRDPSGRGGTGAPPAWVASSARKGPTRCPSWDWWRNGWSVLTV